MSLSGSALGAVIAVQLRLAGAMAEAVKMDENCMCAEHYVE